MTITLENGKMIQVRTEKSLNNFCLVNAYQRWQEFYIRDSDGKYPEDLCSYLALSQTVYLLRSPELLSDQNLLDQEVKALVQSCMTEKIKDWINKESRRWPNSEDIGIIRFIDAYDRLFPDTDGNNQS
jgi:hypothetical protein